MIQKEYKKSEDELFLLIKQKPTYDYWLAKGFILLADVYVQKKDNFQAKATLKSVIDNYVGDDDIISKYDPHNTRAYVFKDNPAGRRSA